MNWSGNRGSFLEDQFGTCIAYAGMGRFVHDISGWPLGGLFVLSFRKKNSRIAVYSVLLDLLIFFFCFRVVTVYCVASVVVIPLTRFVGLEDCTGVGRCSSS